MSQIGEAFVRVRLDTTGVPGDVRRVERQVAGANRELGRFGRGALVGTGALRELGRAAAFASLSFIGGAGIVIGIRHTIQAAMDAQVVLGQTENAVKNAGASWSRFGDEIQRVATEQANLSGFDDERLLRTFSTLVRRTGDVTRSMELNALAVDVARGANLELEQAAKIVLRASVGQARGLALIGIKAREGATGVEILNKISQKYAGSAAQYADTAAGAQARFNVAINETQEAIGTAVLPALTEYLNKATEWLNKTENQARIQRDVNRAAEIGSKTFDAIAASIGGVSDAYRALSDLGGDKSLFEVLTGVSPTEEENSWRKLGGWIYDVSDALGLVADETRRVASAEDLLWAARKRRSMQPVSGIWGIPPEILNQKAAPERGRKVDSTGGNVFDLFGARSATREETTATDLARAQAGGVRSQIEAAVRARQAFITDTIAFANKLLSEGRGDTGKLEATLQSLYGQQGALNDVMDGFADTDRQAREKATQDALDRAAEWRRSNHQYQEAVAAMLKQGRLFHERFRDSVRQQAEEQRERLRLQGEAGLQVLQNNLLQAGLIPNEKKRLTAERKAQRDLIRLYQDHADQFKRGSLQWLQAQRDVIEAKLALRNMVAGKDARVAGFSLQELFAEAGEQFDLYGSNVGGGPLSAQDARGAFAGTVKSHQTTVVQNFYGEKGAGQALSDAARVAKNMKAG